MKKLGFICFVLAAGMLPATLVNAQVHEGSIEDYIQIARSNIRTDKIAIITKAMAFSSEESSLFWPQYRKYEAELAKLFDIRIQLIKDYSNNYDNMTQAKASELAERALSLEGKRTKLKKKYFKKMAKVLSPKKAARFLQIENQLNLLIDLKIAATIPLVR